MAANEMHLYIHLDELSNDSAMAKGGSNKSSKAENSASDMERAVKKLVSYSTLKSVATRMISIPLSQVELQTGETEYAQRLKAGFNIAQQIWNAGETVVIGAKMGGTFGAIAGLTISGLQTVFGIVQRYDTLSLQKSLEDVSIGMQSVRAGTAGSRGNKQ